MITSSPLLLVVGLVFASVLLAIGFWTGRLMASRAKVDDAMMSDDERQRMVSLLQSLMRWTSEYSGNVSSYQSQIGAINDVMQQDLMSSGADPSRVGDSERDAGDARLVTLIGQIMSANEGLQSRLEAAERQLAEQTAQIESYLTEARTDGLTGLFNRRAFDQKLDELFAIYRDGGSAFSLVLVDIDKFKMINDNYGHPVGDVVLQQVASKLETVKDVLIVARFGGEEFAILTDTPIRMAAQHMNEFRKRLSAEPIVAGGDRLNVTISVGLARCGDDLIIGPIVRRADEALYAAKNRGRDRVYFNDGSGPQLVGAPEVSRVTDR
ncbi:MAG: GGDEF domain-containing protein [Planctomycetota bacterium]